MALKQQAVFCLSDGTGITASTLASSLLSQFPDIQFHRVDIPYIDTIKKAHEAVKKIDESQVINKQPALVFSTIVRREIDTIIQTSHANHYDLSAPFITSLESDLGVKASHQIGKTHGMDDYAHYKSRIDAINYTLNTDDGAATHQYDEADIILIGVSRCGKTPTSLYLAMQFAIKVANYPITEEDMQTIGLPNALRPFHQKLFGLSIDLNRLTSIREERRANSQYCSRAQCQKELRFVDTLLKGEKIPSLNSTHYSIEELATKIMAYYKTCNQS